MGADGDLTGTCRPRVSSPSGPRQVPVRSPSGLPSPSGPRGLIGVDGDLGGDLDEHLLTGI
jgi:hypothetical protein